METLSVLPQSPARCAITPDMLKHAPTAKFPVIDLNDYLCGAPGTLARAAAELRYALENVGFATLINHGVASQHLAGLLEEAKRFHALPMAEKAHIATGDSYVGYLPLGQHVIKTSEVNDNRRPDMNEGFLMQRQWVSGEPPPEPGKPFREANKWPNGLPGFREAMIGYWEMLAGFCYRLLPLFAVALDLEPDYFDAAFENPAATLELIHYPPAHYGDNQFGLAPHTDSNFCTILPPANVEGLYVRSAGGTWLKAPRLPGSFILNIGDMCQRWTNDRFRSTEHLAVNLTGTPRYATPFFYGPNADHLLVCLPKCVDAANPPHYPPVTYGEYRRWFMKSNYQSPADHPVELARP